MSFYQIPKHDTLNENEVEFNRGIFDRFKRNMSEMLSELDNNSKDKIELLDYTINLLIDDIQASSLPYNFFNKQYNDDNCLYTCIQPLFPTEYYLKDGTQCSISRSKKVLKLSDINIAGYLRKPKSIVSLIRSIKKIGYEFHDSDTELTYYPYLNIAFVRDGVHHIAIGKYFNEGEANADVYAIEELFGHVRTDGAFFYFEDKSIRPLPISDVKIAALFYVAELKYKEEQKQKNQQTE